MALEKITKSEEYRENMRQKMLGRVFTPEWKNNISKSKKGKASYRPNYSHSEETKNKIRNAMIGRKFTKEWLQKMSDAKKGEKSFKWIKDRTKVIDQGKRKNTEYRQWRKLCFTRDKKQCKINNGDCAGLLTVHHILPFRDYPELRHDVNNGITLCRFHHPLKPSEEKRLSPYFKSLISSK